MTSSELIIFCKELQRHIAKGDLSLALNELKIKLPEQSEKWNRVFLLEIRLNKFSKENAQGILSREDADVIYNRITVDLLNLSNTLQINDFTPTDAPTEQKGRILYQIPSRMKIAEEHRCAIRLAFDEIAILQDIVVNDDTVVKPVRVSEIMEIELISPMGAEAFSIRSFSSAEQFLEANTYTEWLFFVQPHRLGSLSLLIKVAIKELIGERERRREIVLEEQVEVVAGPQQAISNETGFQESGYVISYSLSPGASATTGGRRKITPLAVMITLIVAASILTATYQLGWFDNNHAFVPEDEQVAARDSVDWRQARSANTILDYQQYLAQHPKGIFKDSALLMLEMLKPAILGNDTVGIKKPEVPATNHEKEVKKDPIPDRKSGFEMVAVKGGTYTMGKGGPKGCVKSVRVQDFSIGKYEVTQEDWKTIMGDTPFYFPNRKDWPAESVSWEAIKEFIRKASIQRKTKYRLPTEAEWEYAARGGQKSKGYEYAGSNDLDSLAWEGTNGTLGPKQVGRKQPNELGIYDMSGNVREWCSDIWKENCQGKPNADRRPLRGGGWNKSKKALRVYNRESESISGKNSDYRTGFRLVEDR